MSDWTKARGADHPWHLRAVGPGGWACAEPVGDRDVVRWTDPDAYPSASECCGSCQSIFSGASVERPRGAEAPWWPRSARTGR